MTLIQPCFRCLGKNLRHQTLYNRQNTSSFAKNEVKRASTENELVTMPEFSVIFPEINSHRFCSYKVYLEQNFSDR